MTDVERKLWAVLRNRQIDNWKFRRQSTIGPFIVDFLCVEASLAIELDGGQHNEDVDKPRTEFLAGRGLTVVRFWNHDVTANLEGVVETIRLALQKKTLTQPSPVKKGEG